MTASYSASKSGISLLPDDNSEDDGSIGIFELSVRLFVFLVDNNFLVLAAEEAGGGVDLSRTVGCKEEEFFIIVKGGNK